jgi:hypothetical protein
LVVLVLDPIDGGADELAPDGVGVVVEVIEHAQANAPKA